MISKDLGPAIERVSLIEARLAAAVSGKAWLDLSIGGVGQYKTKCVSSGFHGALPGFISDIFLQRMSNAIRMEEKEKEREQEA